MISCYFRASTRAGETSGSKRCEEYNDQRLLGFVEAHQEERVTAKFGRVRKMVAPIWRRFFVIRMTFHTISKGFNSMSFGLRVCFLTVISCLFYSDI